MSDGQRRTRVVVVGGGISGLAAAYTLARARHAGAPVEESLMESKERLGGVIRTEKVEGFVIEAGPDSFLAEKPEAAALARELGLGNSLLGSNDSERRTYILHRGRLAPLPDGLMLLVPTRIWPMVTTSLLPLSSKLAMAREWFTSPPGERQPADESVASFVTRHFGAAMLENIADPLLAGVYGGDSDRLSVRSVLPRFWEMEREHGSLTRATLQAMRRRREALTNGSEVGAESKPFRRPARPLFMTLKQGLEQLTTQIIARLEPPRISVGRRVLSVEPSAGGGRGFVVRLEGGEALEAGAVILATPTHEARRLLATLNPALATLLGDIPYSSSMTVSLAYDAGTVTQLPQGFGFLVPRHEKRRMLACTFVHGKFKHRAPESKALLRCFLGGARDPEVLGLSDEEAVARVRQEIRAILSFNAEPLFYRVHRWPCSMAQYVVGHAERVKAIQAETAKLPGLFLAGNAFSGIGISDCIRTGRAAAENALAILGN
ncbi:MAG: protoporphyrinogen oxidase [Terriglobia bacterium]